MKLTARARVNLVAALTIITTTVGIAAADRVVLHSQDTITLDGTTYACDVPSSDGVKLALGDRLTVGAHEIRCKGSRAPKAPPVAVESRVDTACVDLLFQTVSGSPPPDEAIRWADACRPFEVGKACTITSQADDPSCANMLAQVISGGFSDRDLARAEASCRVVEASCPASATAVQSSVDTDCLSRLFMAASGSPDDATLLTWIDACRATPVGACTVVGGAQDPACVNSAFQMHPGSFSPHMAGTVARACRTLQLACP